MDEAKIKTTQNAMEMSILGIGKKDEVRIEIIKKKLRANKDSGNSRND